MRHTGFALTLGLLLLAAGPCWGASWTVADTGNPDANGANLQNVLSNSVRLGDTVLLTPGATYTTTSGFVFANKGVGTGTDADYITIQPISLAACPAAGVRVAPATHAATMPKL